MAPLHPVSQHSNRRRVAIVGLMPAQVAVVRQTVGDQLDLRFLPASRRPGFPDGCTQVVLMTKFISHKWQKAAKDRFPSESIHLHHGGISELIRWLAGLSDA